MNGRYEIIEALASADPVTDVDDMGHKLCPLCGASAGWDIEIEHAESCPRGCSHGDTSSCPLCGTAPVEVTQVCDPTPVYMPACPCHPAGTDEGDD